MDKHLKLIILLAVCIILCNQLVHLYQLYKVEKIQYTHRQNELINGTIYEFNMKCPASENTLSFNAFTNKLIYIINHKKTSFQLNTKERTYIRYEQIIYLHIAPKSRNKEINELTPITLQSFVTELLSRLWRVLSANKLKGFINDNFISK